MEAYSVRERPLPDSSSEDNPIYSPPPPRFNHPRPLTTANVDNDDGESSSTSSSHGDGDGLSSSALGLSLAPTYHPRSHRNASHRHPTATILTPISRPPSAVTVPFQPSRPASTVPNGDVRVGAGSGDGRSQPTVPPLFRPSHPIPPPSPQVRPRLVKRSAGPSAAPPFPRAGLERESSGGGRGGSTAVVDHEGAREWEGTREPEPERRERERGPPRRERQRIRSDHKGKGRERDVSVQQQAFDDPLDPFSSLHYLPPPADAAAPAKKPPPGRLASLSSDESLASSSKGILLNGHANGSAIPHQQSLQEILQSVDLSAALRLVQTVQQSQKAAAAAAATLPTPIPTIPTSLPIPPPPPAQSPQRTLPLRTTTRSATAALSSTSGYSLSSIDPRTPLLAEPTSPTSPITPTHVSIEEPSRARPMSMGGPPPTANGLAGVENRERRRTLSLSFAGGNFAVKRNRGPSMSSQLSSIAQERVPDERASLSEVARAFEAEISRVHLTLSPATMRRAQNCAKYLSLRYTPVFNALVAGKSPPNLIAVAKYREMREDEERKSRRAKVGTSGRGGGTTDGEGDFRMVSAAHSDAGSSINGRLSTALAGISHSAYGPRRNKHPKAWEIYPDDFADYLAPPTALQQSFPPHAFNGTMYASIAPPPKSDVQAVSRASTTGGHSSFEFPAGRSTASSEASPISSPTRVDRQSYFPRPSAKSRENSFEGSPLARASRTSLDALLASPTGGAGVRRAGSLGSASVASPKSAGFSSLGTITSHVDFGGALQPIPSRPRNGSKNASLEHLSEPSSPRLGPFYSPPAHHHVTLHKHSQSDGLRQGVSRVVNKIRGKASTDVEASDVVGAGRKRTGLESAPDGGLLSRDVSDVDVAIPPRVHRPASSSGLSDQGGIGRSRIPGRKHVEGHHDGGYKSSGEEGGGRRRFFFGPFGVGPQKKGRMVVDSEGGEGKALAACGNGATPKITHRIFEDSDDEDQPIPREVKDLGDEDFARLNTALRQLRGELAHVEGFLPHVPKMLNSYLDEMHRREKTTYESVGLAVAYTFPRLPAAVVAKLAYDRELSHALAATTSAESSTSDTTSSPSSSSDIEEDEVTSVALSDPRISPPHSPRSGPPPLRPPRVHSRKRSERSNSNHLRRATDPIGKGGPAMRMRSQTVVGPDRRLAHPSGRAVDPLDLLQKAIDDLKRTAREIDEAAERVGRNQDRVGKEIKEVVAEVDETEKTIEGSHLQRLRILEDHYFRLRTALTRPSTSVDLLWAGLSYLLTVLFFLTWLVDKIFRWIRDLVTLPVLFIRWLFFLR